MTYGESPVLPLHAARPTSGGQKVRNPTPAGYCHLPTSEFPMNSRVVFCISVHFRLPLPVQGPSGSRAPARTLPKTFRTIPTYIVYDKIAGILRASPEE